MLGELLRKRDRTERRMLSKQPQRKTKLFLVAVQEDAEDGRPVIVNCESANVESRTSRSRAITFTHSIGSSTNGYAVANQQSDGKYLKPIIKKGSSLSRHRQMLASEAKKKQVITEESPKDADLKEVRNRPSSATKSDGATQKRDNSGSRLFSPDRVSVSVFEEAKHISEVGSQIGERPEQRPVTYESLIQQQIERRARWQNSKNQIIKRRYKDRRKSGDSRFQIRQFASHTQFGASVIDNQEMEGDVQFRVGMQCLFNSENSFTSDNRSNSGGRRSNRQSVNLNQSFSARSDVSRRRSLIRSRASVQNPSMTSASRKKESSGAMVLRNGSVVQKSALKNRKYQAAYESPRFQEQPAFNFRNLESSMSENESSVNALTSIETPGPHSVPRNTPLDVQDFPKTEQQEEHSQQPRQEAFKLRKLQNPLLINKAPVIKVNSVEDIAYSGTHTITHTHTHTVTGHEYENRSILEESYEESVQQHDKALSDDTEVDKVELTNKQFTFEKSKQLGSPQSTIQTANFGQQQSELKIEDGPTPSFLQQLSPTAARLQNKIKSMFSWSKPMQVEKEKFETPQKLNQNKVSFQNVGVYIPRDVKTSEKKESRIKTRHIPSLNTQDQIRLKFKYLLLNFNGQIGSILTLKCVLRYAEDLGTKIQSALLVRDKNQKMIENQSSTVTDTSEETRLLLMSELKNKMHQSLSRTASVESMYHHSNDSRPQMVPVFPCDSQSIQESTQKKRKLRSVLLETFVNSPSRPIELTKTTRAESFAPGTNISFIENKGLSSCKKQLILSEDLEVIEEPVVRETTKISAEEYNDFVEQEIVICDQLPDHNRILSGHGGSRNITPDGSASAGMSHLTNTNVGDNSSLPDFQNARSDTLDDEQMEPVPSRYLFALRTKKQNSRSVNKLRQQGITHIPQENSMPQSMAATPKCATFRFQSPRKLLCASGDAEGSQSPHFAKIQSEPQTPRQMNELHPQKTFSFSQLPLVIPTKQEGSVRIERPGDSSSSYRLQDSSISDATHSPIRQDQGVQRPAGHQLTNVSKTVSKSSSRLLSVCKMHPTRVTRSFVQPMGGDDLSNHTQSTVRSEIKRI